MENNYGLLFPTPSAGLGIIKANIIKELVANGYLIYDV